MKARYTHDCDECNYLGTISYPGPLSDGTAPLRNADLYYCPANWGGGTTIARMSSKGNDYSSMPISMVASHLLVAKEMATSSPALIAAYYFAKAKGLLK